MKSVVKIVTNKPGAAPKEAEYAQIDNQGRIRYGKTSDVKVPTSIISMTACDMGAAVKGCGYNGCS